MYHLDCRYHVSKKIFLLLKVSKKMELLCLLVWSTYSLCLNEEGEHTRIPRSQKSNSQIVGVLG
jgi:hypothetical protein